MKTNELFKIIDACDPSISQIKAYLERMSRQAPPPFELIFKREEKLFLTKQISANCGELIGVILDNHIFYITPLTKEFLNKIPEPTFEDVLEFGKKLDPNAQPRPLTKEHLLIFAQKTKLFTNLRERLAVFGIKLPEFPKNYLLFNDKGEGFVYDLDFEEDGLSSSRVSEFLQIYGDIYFCARI